MPVWPKTPDAVNQRISVTERVRKLETQHQSKTIRPWRWVPDKREANIVAQHSALMGVIAGDLSLGPGASAQSLRDRELAEGYSSAALAKQFTRFRQGIGVYPPQQFFNVIGQAEWFNMGDKRVHIAPALPVITDDDYWTLWAPGYSAMPKPPWSGADVIPGIPSGPVTPHYGQPLAGGGPYGTTGDHFWPFVGACSGSYVFSWAGKGNQFYTGVRNTHYTNYNNMQQYDCGEPPPAFTRDPKQIPGARLKFWSLSHTDPTGLGPWGTGYCTLNPAGGPDIGTGHKMTYIYRHADDIYIDRPPTRIKDSLPGGSTNVETLANNVRLAFDSGHFPLVERWYKQRLPIHEDSTSRYWKRLAVIPPWTGWVEMKIVGATVHLRGYAVLDEALYRDMPIITFPPSVQQYGHSTVLTRVTFGDGEQRLHTFPAHDWGPIAIDNKGSASREITDAGPFPVTVYFDGARFNIWPPGPVVE